MVELCTGYAFIPGACCGSDGDGTVGHFCCEVGGGLLEGASWNTFDFFSSSREIGGVVTP